MTGLVVVIYLVLTAAMIVVGIWITYEIIWRAVRRGMREFNADPALPRHRPRLR